MVCVSSEDSDQPGHPPSLIRVFDVCMKKAWVQHTVKTLVRLGECWAYSHFVGFVMRQLISLSYKKRVLQLTRATSEVIKLCV